MRAERREGETNMAAVKVVTFSPEKAREYWRKLEEEGLVYKYGGVPLQYGHPVRTKRGVAEELARGAESLWRFVKGQIWSSGGITPWLENRAPLLFDEPLNHEKINRQFEERLDEGDEGWWPFLTYDVIISPDGLKLVEAQTAVAYTNWFELISGAANLRSSCFPLGTSPIEALKEIKKLSGEKPIVVIDMGKEGPTRADKLRMAELLGGHFISPLEIRRKGKGDFYYQWNGKNISIKHVLCRMLPSDIEEMEKAIKTEAQRESLKKFFSCDDLNWIWYPAWQTMIDKYVLALAYSAYRDHQDGREKPAFVSHLVPTFGPGETVDLPGWYVQKPIQGNSGHGQSWQRVEEGERAVVPAGYVWQRRISPAPISVQIPPEAGLSWRISSATVELRYMPPMHQGEASSYLMARVAPRVIPPPLRKGLPPVDWFTKTNVAKIQKAMYDYGIRDHRLLPFGLSPVEIVG